MKTSGDTGWFQNISYVKPGYSAVLNDNYLMFYIIHGTAITTISASLLACVFVITSIVIRWKKEKLDFSDRFPFYLAVADLLWGLSHINDHLLLLVSQVYPPNYVAKTLSVIGVYFLGYQQVMHAGLAIYIYLKVVRHKSINLGKMEWKLHMTCVGIPVLSIAVFYPSGAFGSTGYWFLVDNNARPGVYILGLYIAISTLSQALCTIVGYRAIQKEIETHNKLILSLKDSTVTVDSSNDKAVRKHSVATQCLTTFVRISVWFYCPMAFLILLQIIYVIFNVSEPITNLLTVIVSNSSGWANAAGYFYNRHIKKSNLQ